MLARRHQLPSLRRQNAPIQSGTSSGGAATLELDAESRLVQRLGHRDGRGGAGTLELDAESPGPMSWAIATPPSAAREAIAFASRTKPFLAVIERTRVRAAFGEGPLAGEMRANLSVGRRPA